MQKLKVTESFRFMGKHYPAAKKQQELPADAAKFALKEGLAVDPAAEKEAAEQQAREEAERKAQEEAKAAEPEADKNLGNAPENK